MASRLLLRPSSSASASASASSSSSVVSSFSSPWQSSSPSLLPFPLLASLCVGLVFMVLTGAPIVAAGGLTLCGVPDQPDAPPNCGDGILQASDGEECDDGPDLNGCNPDACRSNCKLPFCGDGVQDTPEMCEVLSPLCGDDQCARCIAESCTCEDGYSGSRCRKCQDDWYKVGLSSCMPCNCPAPVSECVVSLCVDYVGCVWANLPDGIACSQPGYTYDDSLPPEVDVECLSYACYGGACTTVVLEEHVCTPTVEVSSSLEPYMPYVCSSEAECVPAYACNPNYMCCNGDGDIEPEYSPCRAYCSTEDPSIIFQGGSCAGGVNECRWAYQSPCFPYACVDVTAVIAEHRPGSSSLPSSSFLPPTPGFPTTSSASSPYSSGSAEVMVEAHCGDSCSDDSMCSPGARCDGATASCRVPSGGECWDDTHCESSFCVRGTCCTTACNSTCSDCSTGTCTPIAAGLGG